ncbi:unnamed protein product [Cylindrotheca closterium]|uniref:Helicase-associated domain-containing protein n=1 Tax=Cylindrotheca closterium TaxID=2856 RepID=A0AAD2FNU7_9STRA|nr:unnamed protein product [Cylindrotheca closterium]
MNHFMEMNTEGTASNISNNNLGDFSSAPVDMNNDRYDNNHRRPNIANLFSSASDYYRQHHQEVKSNSDLQQNDLNSNTTVSRPFFDQVPGATRRINRSNSNLSADQDMGRIITPDFSIFSASTGAVDDLEPLPMNAHQNPQYEAALQSMLKDSCEFLFGTDGISNDCKKNKALSSYKSTASGNKQVEKKRKRKDSMDSDADYSSDPGRFRVYQAEQWEERVEALLEFRRIHGHCSVPYDYPANPSLSRWVKRQRYQYKLFRLGQASAMTERRIQTLESIGFVWDTYTAAWERRISELRAYRAENGDCNVPATYQVNRKLAAWVKCQRRQYKLYQEGKPSTLTADRVAALNRMGFHWEMRPYRRQDESDEQL